MTQDERRLVQWKAVTYFKSCAEHYPVSTSSFRHILLHAIVLP